MKNLILICILTLALSCSNSSHPSQKQGVNSKVNSKTTDQTLVKKQTQTSPFNGTYLFDAEKYKTEQLKHADSIFKKMKPKDLARMMQVFRPFKIQLKDSMATASFSHDIIQGKLKTLKASGNSASLYMTPVDANKKDQTVTLIISGNELVLDPGKKETDKMFFKKLIK